MSSNFYLAEFIIHNIEYGKIQVRLSVTVRCFHPFMKHYKKRNRFKAHHCPLSGWPWRGCTAIASGIPGIVAYCIPTLAQSQPTPLPVKATIPSPSERFAIRFLACCKSVTGASTTTARDRRHSAVVVVVFVNQIQLALLAGGFRRLRCVGCKDQHAANPFVYIRTWLGFFFCNSLSCTPPLTVPPPPR